MNLPFQKRIAAFIVAGALLAMAAYLYQRPYYNWDMFPYMALTLYSGENTLKDVHSEVFTEAKRIMPAGDFQAVMKGHEAYADNPEVFIKTLRYFTIKPGYRLLMKSFYAAGFNLVAATVMPSLLGFLIAGMILLTWLQRNTTQWIAALIVILFSITPFMIEAARLSTPDMITASLLLLGVFLVIEYKIETGLILLLLTVFFRPDSAVFSVLLSVVLYARSLVRLQTGLIFLTMNIMLAVVLIGGVTLIKEFLFTTSDYSPYWSVGVGLTNYGNSLVAGGRSVIHSFTIPLLIVLILLIKFPGPLGDRWRAALMAILLALVSRYFLHPVVEDRFHVGFYLITLMACCVWVVPHIKALRSKSI